IQKMRKQKMQNKTGDGPIALEPPVEVKEIAWRSTVALVLAACVPLLLAGSIVVVPSGMGGVRISQISGTLPGPLYPGVHFIAPLMDSVQTYDLRDHLFTTGTLDPSGKKLQANTGLNVQSKEGLNIGLGITVRYRLDPNKLSGVQSRLPQPADKELVPPVVASAWRDLA